MYSDISKRTTPAIPEIKSFTVNKVLRDTYRLLSATLLFSAVVAGTSIALRLKMVVSSRRRIPSDLAMR